MAILADCTSPSGGVSSEAGEAGGGVTSFASAGESAGEAGLKDRSRHLIKFVAWFEEPSFYYMVRGVARYRTVEGMLTMRVLWPLRAPLPRAPCV